MFCVKSDFANMFLRRTRRFVAELIGKSVEREKQIEACRDPKADIFLEAAVSGKATYIASGDQALLVPDPCENIRMVTPRDFLGLSSQLQS
jgi:predicted nucleic acid-binding protein